MRYGGAAAPRRAKTRLGRPAGRPAVSLQARLKAGRRVLLPRPQAGLRIVCDLELAAGGGGGGGGDGGGGKRRGGGRRHHVVVASRLRISVLPR